MYVLMVFLTFVLFMIVLIRYFEFNKQDTFEQEFISIIAGVVSAVWWISLPIFLTTVLLKKVVKEKKDV